jgi:hypothetical protein
MKRLREKLVADLTRPRPLTEQVTRTLMDRCELRSDRICSFLADGIQKVDEATVDTIFSPMYTPDWRDRARYVEDTERVTITPAVLAAIVDDLGGSGLAAEYLFEDDTVAMRLPEVVIDRWVRRLHLEVRLADRIRQAVEATIPKDAQAEIKALTGQPAWRDGEREGILIAFLTGFSRTGRFSVDKFEFLTGLVHTYRPHGLDHFRTQVDALIQSYHEESGEHFFDAHLKEVYGPEGAMSVVHDPSGDHRQRRLALAAELKDDLAEFAAEAAG